MDVELKPCPFCGAPAHMYSHTHHPGQPDGWCVMCNNMDCKADCSVDLNSQEDAITAWNTRHGAGDADGWRTIESAPTEVNDLSRCGEPLLLGGPGWVETGFYHDGSDCYGHRGEAGWFALEDWGKDKLLCASNIHPTHWRPLPAPPTDDAARAGERGVAGG